MNVPIDAIDTTVLEVRLQLLGIGSNNRTEADAIKRVLYARKWGEAAAAKAWGKS